MKEIVSFWGGSLKSINFVKVSWSALNEAEKTFVYNQAKAISLRVIEVNIKRDL